MPVQTKTMDFTPAYSDDKNNTAHLVKIDLFFVEILQQRLSNYDKDFEHLKMGLLLFSLIFTEFSVTLVSNCLKHGGIQIK